MVNLFERIAEPIRITQTKTEYHIVPDQHRQWATEVYSVDRVASASYLEEPKVYEPFYSLRHGTPTIFRQRLPQAVAPFVTPFTECAGRGRHFGWSCRSTRRH